MSLSRPPGPRSVLGGLIVVAALGTGAVVWLVAATTTSTAALALLGVVTLAAVLALGVRAERRAEQRAKALRAEIVALEKLVRKAHVRQTGRIKAADQRVLRLRGDLLAAAQRTQRHGERVSDRQFEQVQATINLFAMVDVTAPVPPLRGWAVSPDALALLLQELLAVRPRLVVECGSGSSTLFLALAAKKAGIDTRIVALEHEADYAAKTNRLLAAHGVDDIASARVAPFADVQTDRGTQPWYDPSALADLDGIGLLFIDGPPERTSELARYPALPLLWDRLAPGASIVLDDTARDGEKAVIDLWSTAHPELVGEESRTEKGTYVLRRP